MSNYNQSGLLKEIKQQFQLDWDGIHGANHWARVLNNGLAIGKLVDADLFVIALFAFLHDSQRENEHKDPLHGSRAADYAASLNNVHYELSNSQLDLLCCAIRYHSDGLMHENVTVQTCWDADRLDLGRVGIMPSARYLSPTAFNYFHSQQNHLSLRQA